MKEGMLSKGLVVVVILLFIGLAIQPSVAVQQETEIDIEPKDYLFQTIIDIANNPEVKKLIEQYDDDLFDTDIDKSVYRKLLLRNPRLMFNTLFTKPSMSIEYLNFAYENGVKIINTLGEDKLYEIVESIEVTNAQIFEDILNTILNDESLNNNTEILKNINKELNENPPLIILPFTCLFFVSILFFVAIINTIFFVDVDVSLLTVLRIFPLGIFNDILSIIQEILYRLQISAIIGIMIFCIP